MKRLPPLRGFAAVHPKHGLLWSIYGKRYDAQSDAAFAHTDRNGISMPDDWKAARKAGWRVVPVILKRRAL